MGDQSIHKKSTQQKCLYEPKNRGRAASPMFLWAFLWFAHQQRKLLISCFERYDCLLSRKMMLFLLARRQCLAMMVVLKVANIR